MLQQLIHKVLSIQTRIMCILFVHINPQPLTGKYQVIIATNRDEYFVRPATVAHRWPEDNQIIGGKDLEPGREGGTWFGISLLETSQFKFRAAALLNVTGEPREQSASGRGCIVTDYLKDNLTAEEYIINKLKPMKTSAKTYNAFSFVAVEITNNSLPRIVYYTNVTDLYTIYPNTDQFTIGFGNSLLHEPLAKVIAGQEKFSNDVTAFGDGQHRDLLLQKLFELLKCKKQHLPDPVLQRRAPGMEEHLSKVFVNVEQAGYGTRTHTIVLVNDEGKVEFIEDTLLEGKWLRNDFMARL